MSRKRFDHYWGNTSLVVLSGPERREIPAATIYTYSSWKLTVAKNVQIANQLYVRKGIENENNPKKRYLYSAKSNSITAWGALPMTTTKLETKMVI